jgi:mannose-6-phosphate isomerase class I
MSISQYTAHERLELFDNMKIMLQSIKSMSRMADFTFSPCVYKKDIESIIAAAKALEQLASRNDNAHLHSMLTTEQATTAAENARRAIVDVVREWETTAPTGEEAFVEAFQRMQEQGGDMVFKYEPAVNVSAVEYVPRNKRSP